MPSFSNTTGATSGAGNDYSSGAHEFITGFSGVRVARSLVFCVVFLSLCTSSFLATVFSVLRLTDSDYQFGSSHFL